MFNEPSLQYEVPTFDDEEFPSIAAVRTKLSLDFRAKQPPKKLLDHFRSIKRDYQMAYARWENTGESKPREFKNFAKGN